MMDDVFAALVFDPQRDNPTPEEIFGELEQQEYRLGLLRRAWSKLQPVEQRILELRYLRDPGLTQKEIGALYSRTGAWVSGHELRALAVLRRGMRAGY